MKPDRSRYIQHASLWAKILVSLLKATKMSLGKNRTQPMAWESWEACCTDLIERLLNLVADPNTPITVCYKCFPRAGDKVYMYVEESPLAVWDWLDRRDAQRLARIEAQLRLAGGTSYRRFRFVALEGLLYPISSSRPSDIADIMSSRVKKAARAFSWAWCFSIRPWEVLGDESKGALADIHHPEHCRRGETNWKGKRQC